MTEPHRICDELRRAFDGDPWHGSPTSRIVEGISAREAAERPVSGAASIWEIVLHMTAWIREVHRRLLGGQPAEPDGGDWPHLSSTTEAAWQDCLSSLTSAHDTLLTDLEELPEEKLWRTVGSSDRSRELGTGLSYYAMLHGLVQHNVYHSAQIGMLRRLLRTSG